jgi:hypothetical protein
VFGKIINIDLTDGPRGVIYVLLNTQWGGKRQIALTLQNFASRQQYVFVFAVIVSITIAVGTVTRLWLDDLGFNSRHSGRIVLFSETSRPVTGAIQPPVQDVPQALSRGQSGHNVNLTTHLLLVLTLEISGAYSPSI